MIILIVENNKVKVLEECEQEKDLPQEWTLGDQLPYQAIMRYQDLPEYIWMQQIYIKKSERRKGLGTKLMKEIEKIAKQKKKKIRIISTTSTSEDSNNFHLFLKTLKYKKVKDKTLPFDPERIIFEKCF